MNDDPASNIVYTERRPLRRVSAYAGTLEAQRVAEHEHPEIQLVVGLGTETVEGAWHDSGGRRGRSVPPGDRDNRQKMIARSHQTMPRLRDTITRRGAIRRPPTIGTSDP